MRTPQEGFRQVLVHSAFPRQKRMVMHSKFYQPNFSQICVFSSQFLVSFQCLSYLELCLYVLPIPIINIYGILFLITIKNIETI